MLCLILSIFVSIFFRDVGPMVTRSLPNLWIPKKNFPVQVLTSWYLHPQLLIFQKWEKRKSWDGNRFKQVWHYKQIKMTIGDYLNSTYNVRRITNIIQINPRQNSINKFQCMSPVSLVFHTEITVNIGLKNTVRVVASIPTIRCLFFFFFFFF